MPGIDSYTVLMLHMNGSDGSTTFTDSSTYAHSGTANGNAQIDTAQSKFGGASGLFDGSGDYVSFADSADWDFGSGDFTIDFWIKFNSLSGTQAIVTQWGGGGSNGSFYLVKLSSNVLAFFYSTTGSSETEIDSTYTFSDSSWHHVAVVRDGTTLRFFVDGTAYGTGSMSGVTIYNSTRNLNVSTYSDGTGQSVDGWIDELRISKGIARWTSAFTPETSEYASDVTISPSVLTVTASLPPPALPNVTINPSCLGITANAIGPRARIAQSTSYAVKIISYNPLIFISNGNPVQITRVATTSADNPTWQVYTITGAALPTDVAVDATNGYIYMSTSSGQVYKINSTPFSYSVVNLSDSDNLTNVEVFSDSYLAYASTVNSIGEAYLIDFRSYTTIDTNFQCLANLQVGLETYFSTNEGRVIPTDFRYVANINTVLSTNFCVLASSYSSITPMSMTDWHVYVDNVELIPSDLDLRSIVINHTVDEQSKASFRLARRHDQLNTAFNGGIVTITNQNTVKIYIGSNLEFEGRIAEINTSYGKSTESVEVVAYSDEIPSGQYNSVTLPLPGLTENLSPYHVLIQNPKIFNPYISATDTNPKKYLGIKVKLGIKETESIQRFRYFGNTATLADNIVNSEFTPKQNWTYFWFVGASKVVPDVTTETTTTPTTNTGSATSIFTQAAADISAFMQAQQVLFHDLNTSFTTAFSTAGVNFSNFPSYNANRIYILQYIGTSLAGLNSNLWNLQRATYYYQRERTSVFYKLGSGTITAAQIEEEIPGHGSAIFSNLVSSGYITSGGTILETFKESQSVDDFDVSFGESFKKKVYSLLEDQLGYTVGSAPYKEVSVRNGVLVPRERWVDGPDGLYVQLNDAYNFIEYAKRVAELEYEKIKNINGQVLPLTDIDVNLTLDGYYYYGVKLLTRINITNTTEANIFNGSNGFPTSVKSITLSASDAQVRLETDNQKSTAELEAIDGAFPNEDDLLYNEKGYYRRDFNKYDYQSESIIE